jgi:hypothetical protein
MLGLCDGLIPPILNLRIGGGLITLSLDSQFPERIRHRAGFIGMNDQIMAAAAGLFQVAD